MTSEPRSEVVSFPEPNKGGCVEMQVASDFRDLSIWLFLGVGVGQRWVKRQKTDSGGESVATEPYTYSTRWSTFPATSGPESFRALSSEVGRWVIWASTLQTCSASPQSALSLEIRSRRIAFWICWHRKKKLIVCSISLTASFHLTKQLSDWKG